tara:strand:+ start:304 stop:477 length:174 start_codon:yes stop_codon:yes gene_type:complete
VTIGTNVANKKDKNNKDCDTKTGKKSTGMMIPTSKDFEKSGDGKNNIPAIKPTMIEM